jgi:hypothetical protein
VTPEQSVVDVRAGRLDRVDDIGMSHTDAGTKPDREHGHRHLGFWNRV